MWGLLALLLGPIALIVLALMPPGEAEDGHDERHREPQRSARQRQNGQQRRPSAQNAQRPRPSRNEDPSEPMRVTPQMRWRFLTEYDPAVRAAISEVAPLGAAALEELKNAYLMVEDQTMLPLIIARIRERVVTLPRQPDSGPARYQAELERRHANGADAPLHPAAAPRSPGPVAHEAPPPAYTNGAYHPRRPQPLAQPAEQDLKEQAASPYPPQNANRPRDYAPPPQQAREPARPVQRAKPVQQAQPVRHEPPAAELDRVRMPGRFEPQREAAAAQQQRPETTQRARTGVTAADLVGAAYLETFRNIHIFRLRDGRFYIDKHLAVMSLDQAHAAVDFIIQQRRQRS